MGEVKQRFEAAVRVIHGLPRDGSYQPSNDMKLKFYAFYKQAKEGPCKASRPGFWDLISRAKHDAWAQLGDMDKHTAMENYVEALKQIIETINFNADVEKFIEVLGPFYEYVDEDKLLAINPQWESGDIMVRQGKDTMDHTQVDNAEQDTDLNMMLGHFTSSLEDQEEKVDCNENWEQPGRLLEEIRWTKESLEHTMAMLKEVSNGHRLEEEEEWDRRIEEEEEATVREDVDLNQRDIDRLLDNVAGFLPNSQMTKSPTDSHVSFLSQSVHSCQEDSDQEEEVFEDSLEVSSYIRPVSRFEDSLEMTAEDARPLHLDVRVSVQHTTETDPSPLDSGIYDSSPESQYPVSSTSRMMSGGISSVSDVGSVPNMSNIPSVPRLHAKKPTLSMESEEEEEDEILIVTSSRVKPVMEEANPVYEAVERMAGDMEHLRARVTSLETILTLKQERSSQLLPWWPFSLLNPRTLLFLVTWPLLTHGMIHLAKLAVRRARK